MIILAGVLPVEESSKRHRWAHPEHRDLARRIRAENLTFLSFSSFRQLSDELIRLDEEDVAGDAVECGMALGGSGVFIASLIRNRRRFFGFDVFQMIPPPGERDPEKAHNRYAVIKSGKAHSLGSGEYYGYRKDLLNDVKDTFRQFKLDVESGKIQFIRGPVEETTPAGLPEKIAFAHIDTDWYRSVSHLLPLMAERMDVGGTIIVDDYHAFAGARDATNEFLAADKRFEMISTSVNGLLRRLR